MAGNFAGTKEDFIKNLNGTSFLEISSIVSYAPISCLLYFATGFVFLSPQIPLWQVFCLENIFLVLPGLMAITVMEGYSFFINVSMLAACLILLIPNSFVSQKKSMFSLYQTKTQQPKDKKQFVLNFRAFMNIATIMSILGVDFNVFPRRLAKTEVYGTGLLDIGVGSFIFSHGIVSSLARGKMNNGSNKLRNSLKNVISCLPIIIIGLLRLLSVKATNYQEHATEYGVHWNFFFTLAFVKIISEVLINLLPKKLLEYIGLVGATLAVTYQYLLSQCGLKSFIQKGSKGDGSRNGFLDANREGVVSCAGYIALYFIAIQFGKEIFKTISNGDLLKRLAAIDIFLWLCTLGCGHFVEPVSRQMANAAYILWIISLNVYLLSCFLVVEIVQEHTLHKDLPDMNRKRESIVSPRRPLSHHQHQNEARSESTKQGFIRSPLLVQSISRNQLFFFLLGNVLTGIINLSIKTMQVDSKTSIFILTAYLLAVNGVVVLLHIKNIATKFW